MPHVGHRRRSRRTTSTLAAELGYAVKLLAARALGRRTAISARVAPTLVPLDHPLARRRGRFNAVMLRGDAIREMILQGPGAGGDETATAVIGDLLAVVGTPAPASCSTTATTASCRWPPDGRAERLLRAPDGRRPARRAGPAR